MMIQTPQALIDNGWNYYEKCRCQRILKYKYRHPGKPGLELEWWVKYFQFKINIEISNCIFLRQNIVFVFIKIIFQT